MGSRALNDLLRPAYERAERFIVACEREGLSILVYCTYRSMGEQAALYAQGRDPVEVVNDLRQAVGLPALSFEEGRRRVTMAAPGQSLHQYRLAFDCVIVEAGKPVWDGSATVWQDVGIIGERAGLEWAGRWTGRLRETGHFQYSGGLSVSDLAAGKRPG